MCFCFSRFSVDKLDLQSGVLADVNQEVILEVKPSNDPNGYIVFPLESREISVAEDVLTGSEASTLATLQVQRQNGAFDEIQVREIPQGDPHLH